MKSMGVAVFTFLFAGVGFLQAQALTDAQKADIEKTVKEVVLKSIPLYERLDLEGLVKEWSRDKFIGYVFAGKEFTTFDSMKAEWKRIFDTRKGHKFEMTGIRVRILGPAMALVWWNGPWSIIAKDDKIYNYLGSMFFLYVKEGGTWKIAFSTSNSATVK